MFLCLFPNPVTRRTLTEASDIFLFFFLLLSKSSHELISFLYLNVFFYDFCIVLTVTPAWIQGNDKGVIGHFAWRKKKITFTYFAFTTAKKEKS